MVCDYCRYEIREGEVSTCETCPAPICPDCAADLAYCRACRAYVLGLEKE